MRGTHSVSLLPGYGLSGSTPGFTVKAVGDAEMSQNSSQEVKHKPKILLHPSWEFGMPQRGHKIKNIMAI